MKRKAGAGEPTSEAADASAALAQAGNDEAMKGMAALNAWWASLTPRQQKDMGQDFGAMRKAARKADEGVQP